MSDLSAAAAEAEVCGDSEEEIGVEVPDPYRVLFPLGIASGALGVLLWVLFPVGLLGFYPRDSHLSFMFFAFLWAFIAGFLMTAVPRMTRARTASWSEITLASLLVFFQWVWVLRQEFELSKWVFFAQQLFLVAFLARRFWVFRKVPFSGFIFLPFAFALSIAGVFTHQLALLSGEAFVMNLIVGLGSRLIPALNRLPLAPTPDQAAAPVPSREVWIERGKVAVAALVLNASYVLQLNSGLSDGSRWAVALRVGVLLYWSVVQLRVFELPPVRTWVGWGLKVGVVFLVLGQALQLSTARVAALHLTFVGGFSLITLLVGTRVMLAHGGKSLDEEVRSLRFPVLIALVGASALLRWWGNLAVTSFWIEGSVFVFLLSLGLWIQRFVQILKQNRPQFRAQS